MNRFRHFYCVVKAKVPTHGRDWILIKNIVDDKLFEEFSTEAAALQRGTQLCEADARAGVPCCLIDSQDLPRFTHGEPEQLVHWAERLYELIANEEAIWLGYEAIENNEVRWWYTIPNAYRSEFSAWAGDPIAFSVDVPPDCFVFAHTTKGLVTAEALREMETETT